MSARSASHLTATVATRLRAAGCVFAAEEAELLVSTAGSTGQLDRLVEERADGRPLEQVLGWAAFGGLRIVVEPGVFVPRRRTELLVDRAARVVPRRAVVVDLCCGTGAVGAALLARRDGVELHAIDVDPAAVRCARRNVARAGTVYLGDLYEPLPVRLRGRVDVIAANAPYVPTAELGSLPVEARRYEPVTALDGGEDGLDVQRRVIAEAARWLTPAGHLLVEVSGQQAARTVELFRRHGLVPEVARSPQLEATVVIGHPVGGAVT